MGGMRSDATGEWREGAISRHACRLAFESFFNGDLSDAQFIYHHLPAGSDLTDQQVEVLFEQEAPCLLLPKLLDYFPRSRWTGAFGVIQQMALLGNCNNLLSDILKVWLSTEGAAAPPVFASL
jgi:hypothetical protein